MMNILPFNFDRMRDGRLFVSNLSGFHTILSEQSVKQLIEGGADLKPEEIDLLKSRHFIASDDSYETIAIATTAALAKKLLSEIQFKPIFMIVPTLRCDHTCHYCQVSRASINAKNYDLKPEDIPTIINTIARLSEPPYKIELQGGEPLLRFDLIKRIYEEAEIKLGSKDFQLVIATSLSLLDDEMVEWSRDKQVYYSTSLDGTQIVHNTNRILPGSNSYERLKSSVSFIGEALGKDRVSTVTTVTDKLIANPGAIIDAHLELALPNMFVRPISPYGFANGKSSVSYDISDYMRFYDALFSELVEINRNGNVLIEHSALIHMKRIFNPAFSQYADLKSPSGFLLNCILFNYDGKMFGSDEARMLQRIYPDIDFSLATLYALNLNSNDLTQHILANGLNMTQPGCDLCAYQPYCGSDPCQNISDQGEPVGDKSKSLFCQYHKAMFRYLIERYYSDPEARLMLEAWNSDPRY